MSKKILNIGLLVITVIVYAAITYKFIGNTSAKEEKTTTLVSGRESLTPVVADNTNNFQLVLNQRDPFLDKSYRQYLANQKKSQQQSVKVKTTNQEPLIWPDIQYLGFTKSDSKKNPTAILRVDGKLYRKRKGSTIEKTIKILSIHGDSIQLRINNKKQFFARN